MPQRWNERLPVFRCTLFFGVGVLANRCSKRNLCATAFIVVSLAFVNDCGYKRWVRDFGAIGNGTADDRRAIQATIDDVAAQGGSVVYFQAGSYKISIYTPGPGQFPWPWALTIRPNITLQGVGANSSIIKLANNQVPYGALFAPEPLDSDVMGFTHLQF
jgi:Pectate lyase superfamily protein